MIRKAFLWILTALLLPVAGQAQQKNDKVPFQFRAVLHDPVHPAAEMYYTDYKGAITKLNFRSNGLTPILFTLPVNGSMVLYDKAEVDLKKPEASLSAIAKLPLDVKRAIVLVVPAAAGTTPPYRLIFIDDSIKVFPKGESRVLSMLAMETAIQAGEHRVPVHPGSLASVPPVKKVNEYNMAQTNFYYKQGEAWVPFSECQVQYLDACRRLFIVHVTPGALQPSVTTILDTAITPAPRKDAAKSSSSKH